MFDTNLKNSYKSMQNKFSDNSNSSQILKNSLKNLKIP